MFSWPNKWEHASFGPNKRSVDLAQKNLDDLRCKYFMQHQKQENFLYRKKKPLSASESFSKKLLNVCWKNQSGLFHDRCRLLSFQFNPWTKFAWYQLGKVRSASSCEASILDLDRSCFLADVDCHLFRSISVNNIFFFREGLMFSWPNKWEHASFGPNKRLLNVAEKYQSGLFHDRCRQLSFQFNPWTKFALYQFGKVRSASSCDPSFLDLDRSCFLVDVDCQFFRSISGNIIFLLRWANVFHVE